MPRATTTKATKATRQRLRALSLPLPRVCRPGHAPACLRRCVRLVALLSPLLRLVAAAPDLMSAGFKKSVRRHQVFAQ